MAVISPYWVLDIFLLLTGWIVYSYINFKLRSSKYWARRGIPYEEPYFLLGNTKEATVKKPFANVLGDVYYKHKDKKLVGMWTYVRPVLLAIEMDFIKDILVKDFAHFHDRGMVINEELEPLTGQKWRNLRVKLTPTFTSGKMKMMYEAMYEVGLELQRFLETPASEGVTIEMKEILACFTTDIISSCAFGVESKSLENPRSEFRRFGRMIFEAPLHILISSIAQFVMPGLNKYLTLRNFDKDVSDFFMKAVKDVMAYRDKNNVKRKDFMELLIELKKKGKIDDADNRLAEKSLEIDDGDPFTEEQAAAQAFVFFFAGFETSSTTMMFTLYELACNPDIQTRLQKEIDEGFEKCGGKLSYTELSEMKYMDQVVQESLRKYPPVPVLFRECTKEYHVPEMNITLEKGDFIMVPVDSIQNDPDFFPNPERFDPERFSTEEKAKRDSFLPLTFGAGPRVCIGARFGLQQVKVGLALILSRYRLDVADSTPIPIKFDPKMFIPSPVNGMPLKISRR